MRWRCYSRGDPRAVEGSIVSTLVERQEDFASLDHPVILEALLAALEIQGAFGWHRDGRLRIEADALARAVLRSRRVQNWNERDLLSMPSRGSPRACTLHMSGDQRDRMRGLLRRTSRRLREGFAAAARDQGLSAAELFVRLTGPAGELSPSATFGKEARAELQRPFSAERKRLTYTPPSNGPGKPLLCWHRLVITVEVPEGLQEGLAARIGEHFALRWPGNRNDIDEVVREQQGRGDSEIARLATALDTQTLGQIKAAAQFYYLHWLRDQLDRHREPAFAHLDSLIGRLEAFTRYLRDPERPDDDYAVEHGGARYTLRTLFGQPDAFDDLPVFPRVAGNLGETTDRTAGERRYIFGLKLKLNGPVNAAVSQPSFSYHLGLLRGEPEMGRARGASPERLIRLAVLYHIVFAGHDDPAFQPLDALEARLLPRLRAAASSAVPREGLVAVCATVAEACTGAPVDDLVRTLRRLVKREGAVPARSWDIRIGVQPGILESERATVLEEGRLLKRVFNENRREYLSYLEVSGPAIDTRSFFSLRGRIAIDQVQSFDAKAAIERCDVGYDVGDLTTLPVSLVVRSREGAEEQPTSPPVPTPGVVLICKAAAHAADAPLQWFVYRYIFALVSYFGLQAIAEARLPAPGPLFVSLVRTHGRAEEEGDDEDPEGFIAMLGKVLAHVLGSDYLANSQGFVHAGNTGSGTDYRKRNAASSLYAPLRKRFRFRDPVVNDIGRLALLVVSSREADSEQRSRSPHLATIVGAITEIADVGSQTVQVQQIRTFAETYPGGDLHSDPSIILDQVDWLYARGFRHIMYVAQAPYSSMLHVTTHNDGGRSGLFFLSRPILEACVKDRPDLAIYPVFREQYAAMKINSLDANTLYIQDSRELLRVVNDQGSSQQLVVFLNLFSGLAGVGGAAAADRYNGVVSYATLLNVYGGILNETELRRALVDDLQGPNPRKDTIVRYLTLFHMAHYEAARSKIALKLDPYSAIIGPNSTGAVALRAGLRQGMPFNFLSFLAEARKAVRLGDTLA